MGGVGAFVEGLEEGHFSDGVSLGRGEFAAVVLLPGLNGLVTDEHGGVMPGLAVGGDAEDVFDAAIAAGAIVAVAFIEVLIDVAALRGVRFHAAEGGSA